jgi:hypothetical protein
MLFLCKVLFGKIIVPLLFVPTIVLENVVPLVVEASRASERRAGKLPLYPEVKGVVDMLLKNVLSACDAIEMTGDPSKGATVEELMVMN